MTTMLQDYATWSAERNGGGRALVMDGVAMSYGELDAESNRLARLLLDVGCRRGDRVCLLAEKCPAAVMAMQAVLKAGAAYVPLDLASPAARAAKILGATEPALVLATHGAEGLLDELAAAGKLTVPVGFLDAPQPPGVRMIPGFGCGDWSSLSAEPTGVRSDPMTAAHILFTSGSTGTPKGVVITHANVIAFLDWAVPYFSLAAFDRHSGHPPLHFDLSTFDIYGTFRVGAELHLVPPILGVNPRRLASLIRDSRLTQWFSVPSVLAHMANFDAVAQDDFPDLKRLLWCGEVLPTPILAYWMRRLPHVRFTNLYGPTEATIASTYYTVPEPPDDETRPIPIGTACDGEEVLVLDADQRPVGPGELGELFIAGLGLSPGYWRDPLKTAAAFPPDPRAAWRGGRVYRTGDLGRRRDDGLLEYVGRLDSQIKSRGYRIELGEVEAALGEIAEVTECAVVGIDSEGFEGTAICCAYACREGVDIDPIDLRRTLSKLLPVYMHPTRWREFTSLPRNMNGKIDRRAIRAQFTAGVDTESTASPVPR